MDLVPGEVPNMHNEKMRDEENRQEQDLSNEKIEENEETSQIESQLDMSKPQQQILVIFTDKNNDGEKGEDRMKGESVNTRLTTPTVGENVSLLAMECSDLIPDVDPDMAPTNRSDTATVSAKPDSTISPQPPPKPHCKSPPNPTVTHPQLNDTMRAGAEEKMERTQDDEQWRGKDLVDKERDEKEEEGKDRERDQRGHSEEGGRMKDEDKEEGMDEVAEDQPAETESLGDLMECRIKRRNPTSGSLFGSFRACSPVKLVEELLSGDEWSQFLYGDQSSDYDPCPFQTHCEDTGELSVDLQFNSSAELDLPVDVFEGSPAVQEEPIYEDIDRSTDTNPMTPRTKDIYDTVEFIQPVQPANTYLNFSDIKSHRVLDCAVQKYLIKLSKKRKHRTAWKYNRTHGGHSSSSTSPQQVFPASIFYNIPALGGEEQLSAVKQQNTVNML
ncbi:hypothetical protein D9C73_003446 [Collichthys lucidus]|uniref:Uncharacterized protein n=1 Tax=Collichthys lucidus TaxID=240159 RepID=A0A4V6AMP5_COLLU|nr:hypothetical protein D9C73_003446 [Collichthys lucidus]